VGRDRDRARLAGLRHHSSAPGGGHVTSLTRAIAALAAFVILAVLVALGAPASLDRAILALVQRPHASWLDLAASVVTVLGQTEIVGTVALGVAVVRLRAGRGDWWVPLLVAVVLAVEIVSKLIVPQTPPPTELARSVPLLPFLEAPTTFSFPSGHVARLAFLVSVLRWPTGVSAAVVFAMALTRVYLAEHWPSDVVGGWLLGYGIAAVTSRRP
jgi:undecaprenyl-diphosphatase